MKSYVDDIRWLISKVRKGMIWYDITKRLIFDQERYQKMKARMHSENPGSSNKSNEFDIY